MARENPLAKERRLALAGWAGGHGDAAPPPLCLLQTGHDTSLPEPSCTASWRLAGYLLEASRPGSNVVPTNKWLLFILIVRLSGVYESEALKCS